MKNMLANVLIGQQAAAPIAKQLVTLIVQHAVGQLRCGICELGAGDQAKVQKDLFAEVLGLGDGVKV